MGVSNRQIQEFVTALQEISEHGIVLKDKHAGAVKVGDYLLYEHTEYEETPDDRLRPVVKMKCARVCATGGEQGSGPRPGQNWVAVEGDKRIKQYVTGDHVLVLEPPEEPEGIPEGRLTAIPEIR